MNIGQQSGVLVFRGILYAYSPLLATTTTTTTTMILMWA